MNYRFPTNDNSKVTLAAILIITNITFAALSFILFIS